MKDKSIQLIQNSRAKLSDASSQAERKADRDFWKRLPKVFQVRRFVLVWLGLIGVLSFALLLQTRALSSYHQYAGLVPGGTFTEGIVGNFTNANPMYAVSAVDRSASKLVFSSLMTYDNNNKLVGDLAESVETDERGAVWKVALKPGIIWHDGRPLTAQDVVFTYETIQNPDADSHLHSSWREVEVRAIDDLTVEFELPNGLGSFPHNLTNGIVPKHLLENVPATSLRTVNFNTVNPIGSGPFAWDAIEVSGAFTDERRVQIGFRANDSYYLGRPKLDRFVIKTFVSEEAAINSFKARDINAIVGLETVPPELADDSGLDTQFITQTGAVMVFFKVNDAALRDTSVRRGLVSATDTSEIISNLDEPSIRVDSPFLRNQFPYDSRAVQFGFSPDRARSFLSRAGWGNSPEQTTLTLTARDSLVNQIITEELKQQWQTVGVDLEIKLLGDQEFQTAISTHDYQLLLHGISIGADPDIFPYWHSTQADVRSDTRLNFSEYSSDTADEALEGGRTRTDEELRKAKYQPFLRQWRDDAPAIGLYQPRLPYIKNRPLLGLDAITANSLADRLNNVHEWMARPGKVPRL